MLESSSVYLGRKKSLGSLELKSSGKVRDIYGLGEDRLVFVTSDRVSAFDVIMPAGIPHKGRVLTAIATHWFARTADLIPNHLISTDVDLIPGLSSLEREELSGRVMVIERCEPTSIEWVVRGYIAGSGWKEYQARGTICGIALPPGLSFCDKLPEPILTPTTKADLHDVPLSPREAREAVGHAVYDQLHRASLELFRRGTEVLAQQGILLADTKFEFGERNGRLILIDEALTPDSSRFWPAAEYAPGRDQPSYDKQILRNWLETLDWNKEAPGPELPADLVLRISKRYLEICEKITGSHPVGVAV